MSEDGEQAGSANVSTSYDVPEFVCWAKTQEELCKAFVFQWFASNSELANFDGGPLVRSMDAVYQWMRHGTVPPAATKPRAVKAAE